MKFKKRSQVSLFLVMALIVIMAGALYFIYREDAAQNQVGGVDPKISPVKSYVEECLGSVTEDGLQTIGLTGGYVSIPERTSSNPRAYLTTFPGKGFKIPYWWHDGIEAIPTEEFIREQLEEHIRSELGNCIDKFSPLAEKFDIRQPKEPGVRVNFNLDDVTAEISYPLEISGKGDGFRSSLENFAYASPIRFKKVYELAKAMMERENSFYFFERKAIDLISMDSDIPTTDMEATCKEKVWSLEEIKKKIRKLLEVNIAYIRVKGTDYNPSIYVPNPDGENVFSKTYYNNNYVWDINTGAGRFGNMKVAFTHDRNYPLKVFARPSQNGILRANAQKGSEMLSFLCLYIWHFTYDIRYPVMATIIDKQTDKNREYVFNFAFEVSVDHNQPNRISKGFTVFEDLPDIPEDDYCSEAKNEVAIFTIDNSTGDDISGVNLSFTCGRSRCDIGESQWLGFGSAAGLARKLPFCVNGIIEGRKAGYSDSKSLMQTDSDGSSFVLMMNPIKQFSDFTVVKHSLSDPSAVSELGPGEKASISINGKDAGLESYASYPQEGDSPLKLAAGRDFSYDVTIYLTDGNDIFGGYSGEWKVKGGDLEGAVRIVFHVVEQGPASEEERYRFLSGLGSYSKNVPGPEIK